MKWIKSGKIFDPSEHAELADYIGYAQSPQAVVLDDRIRVYFSIRKAEKSNFYLSYVHYVDFTLDFSKILAVSKEPVIPPGKLGAFDEHGIFPFSPFIHDNKILAYTCGWSRRASVSVETATGLAVSKDKGETFQRVGDGPVLAASLHEPFLVGDSFVRFYEGEFHMWYMFGTRWICENGSDNAERIYKIGHATSDDGIHWKRDGIKIIEDVNGDEECQALPTVLFHRGKYHMFFCHRHVFGFRTDPARGYRLGYAWSEDLRNWTRDDDAGGMERGPDQWDQNMMCYPHLLKVEDQVYLLYNGNNFGKYGFGLAKSADE